MICNLGNLGIWVYLTYFKERMLAWYRVRIYNIYLIMLTILMCKFYTKSVFSLLCNYAMYVGFYDG